MGSLNRLEDVSDAKTIADLPVQHAQNPANAAESRARFFNPGNAFDIQLPAVPDHIFTAEPRLALSADTPTGLIPCDLSKVMTCAFPATFWRKSGDSFRGEWGDLLCD